ncbi:MAG: DUF1353 domain-containing protein [Acidimicrobiales bacterium]
MERAQLRSGELQVQRLSDGRRRLLRDLEIDLRKDLRLGDGRYPGITSPDSSTVVTVPKAFVTDFSSIPAFARALYRFDAVDLAGCCHDWAYYVGVPKPQADEIWRLVAISGTRRVSRWRGRLGWLALRVGGHRAYRSHAERRRKREQEGGEPIASPLTAPKAA